MTGVFANGKDSHMNTQHPLAKWIETRGETRAEFARRTAISESHLSLILSRKRGVSLDVAARFERATDSEVKAVDLVREAV